MKFSFLDFIELCSRVNIVKIFEKTNMPRKIVSSLLLLFFLTELLLLNKSK